MSTGTEELRAAQDGILAAAQRIKDAGPSAPKAGRDPVNSPMIHNWVEAMGDDNPIYVDEQAARAAGHDGIVAPPAMAQVWTMRGLHGERSDDDPLGRATELFDEAGYTSVVATNCDSVYHRYLRPGEEVSLSSELIDVVGPKQTALGEGWFFTTHNTWRVGDEVVAEMDFRILKFKPGTAVQKAPAPGALDPAKLIRPQASGDTAFFWDGVAAHELRIQKLPSGGLQHPPIPATWTTRDDDGVYGTTDYVVASGRGTVYSFVVHHAPRVPGRTLPFVVALVELEEGVRMLGELRDVDPGEVAIGMPVRVEFLDFPADDRSPGGWSNYAWVPADDESPGLDTTAPSSRSLDHPNAERGSRYADSASASSALDHPNAERAQNPADRAQLPELTVEATPTFVVSTALATRDFQDVHHDRDLAQQRGSKDIFVNILTDTGLVERFVTDWAGPSARITSIALKLGVPWYAYDTLTFTGEITGQIGNETTVSVTGTNSLGKHVISTVTLESEGVQR
ncbi:hypothetical protein GOARA_082_00920 [Gordonia araii NBRC 100433]|uniref:N-terminal of MaoC-like dehydratase domain-containing protein n=1 Tax=Gordonia araii NBRC 100433 TaxID=1073574 RepID=G7H778_9ACTN|nr:hypothetical protein GOARA_082_00920 [Gordonia araii NBRC 100433]